VTFQEPTVLVGLVLVPLAAIAYLMIQRRRTREAAAFASPALMPNVLTRRPGWRRHVPPALALLALAVLVVALARPERSIAAPQRQATVIMVTDVSGSMEATDVSPSRLEAAIKAARTLVDELPENFRLGMVTFSDVAQQAAPPGTDREPVKAALDRLVADGGTAMGDGLARGLEAARAPVPNPDGDGVRRLPAIVVLLSDGKNTSGGLQPLEVAARARQLKIPINTVALGTDEGYVEERGPFGLRQRIAVPPDRETLRQIARTTGGRAFEAEDADKLRSIYAGLGTRLSGKKVQQEVTAALAGGALVLLIAGGALSLAWFGRVP
jgi:Ca-activated chloride channel homolog